MAFGGFYATVPVTDLSKLLGHTSPSKGYSTPFPDFRVEAWVAIGALTMLALVLWLASLRRPAVVGRPNRLLSASRAVAWGAGIVIGVVVVIPTLVFAASWILSQFSGSKHFAIGGPIVGVVVSYLATIGAVAWRSKKTIMSAVSAGTGSGDKGSSITAAIPTGVTQRLLVGLSLLILAAGWLMLFAGAILTNGKSGAWISAGVVALIVIWLGVFQDETSLSMHPYYRQRLATAFANRVFRNQSGARMAQAYPPAELTSLDTLGNRARERRLPRGYLRGGGDDLGNGSAAARALHCLLHLQRRLGRGSRRRMGPNKGPHRRQPTAAATRPDRPRRRRA